MNDEVSLGFDSVVVMEEETFEQRQEDFGARVQAAFRNPHGSSPCMYSKGV